MNLTYKNLFKIFFIPLTLCWANLIFGIISCSDAKQDKPIPYLYEIYITKAITNTRILPKTYPIPGSMKREIAISACRGEFEPASFVIHALTQIKDLQLSATDLKGEQCSIPSSSIDIRVVKCWFQSGLTVEETNKCILTPELLLKDDKLIFVDQEGKRNFCRTLSTAGKENYILISGPLSGYLKDFQPKDSDTLRPVDIDVGSIKQFWVTLQVPDNVPPGLYEGKINLAGTNIPLNHINIRLRVLPFTLEKPALHYSIYYLGQLTSLPPEVRIKKVKDGKAVITCKWKSPQQYYAEMKNLKDHGVEYPTLEHYDHQEKNYDEQIVRQMIEIPRQSRSTQGYALQPWDQNVQPQGTG